ALSVPLSVEPVMVRPFVMVRSTPGSRVSCPPRVPLLPFRPLMVRLRRVVSAVRVGHVEVLLVFGPMVTSSLDVGTWPQVQLLDDAHVDELAVALQVQEAANAGVARCSATGPASAIRVAMNAEPRARRRRRTERRSAPPGERASLSTVRSVLVPPM